MENINKINFEQILEYVINGLKSNIPIYKTLKKYNWSKDMFYKKLTPNDKRYLEELKCLKVSRRCQHSSRHKRTDLADFNIL